MQRIIRALPTVLVALGVAVAPNTASAAVSVDTLSVPARTQIAVQQSGGGTVATANAHESRPALSLSKLYLGYWVLYHGNPADKAQVEGMIRSSNDGVASALEARYPQAIPAIISDFGLSGTSYSGFWGTSSTSAADVARFISEIRPDPVAEPLLRGMQNASPIAADGYPQDFGTATVAGAQGTKFGWSDARDVHATVTFGEGWVMAASTYGPAETLTADVQDAVLVTCDVPAELPGSSELPVSRELLGVLSGL